MILIAPNWPNQLCFPDRTELLVALLADPRQEGSAISDERRGGTRTRSCGAFMCGCFGDIRGAECPAFSCARHALGGAGTLYEVFVCSEMGSVCEIVPLCSYRPGCLLHVGCSECSSGSLLSTLKVYVAAIASFRSPLGGQSIGRHALVVSFSCTLHPPRPPSVPPWVLEVVLIALSQLQLEPFTFMHLADAFIQSDLQCIQAIHLAKVHFFLPLLRLSA